MNTQSNERHVQVSDITKNHDINYWAKLCWQLQKQSMDLNRLCNFTLFHHIVYWV